MLEIGPGKGALTKHLVGTCRSLILIELDRELAAQLEERFGKVPGVRVLNRDVLGTRLGDLTPEVERLTVVGNIPYNITTPIIFHLLSIPRPKEILLMVQKEVGERVLASPGTSAFGALTVGVQAVAHVKKVLRVPPKAFRPVPAVDSMVLRITPQRPEPLSPEEEADLRSLTRTAFQQRRKQFQSILRNRPALGLTHEEIESLENTTGFNLKQRPETFSPKDFISLSRALRGLNRV